MIGATILGATGYTGIELIRILSSHPEVRIIAGSSRQWAGKNINAVLRQVNPQKSFELHTMEEVLANPSTDVAFLALPHGESAAAADRLFRAGIKAIDLSADLRLRDVSVYESWYGKHHHPGLLDEAVYGLPELYRDEIKSAKLVANPGCYPTTVILGTAPLYKIEEIDAGRPIVDSKSGISGAGRGAKLNTSFCESGEGFKPYGVTRHRHIPEMEQELSKIAGREVKVRFTPHLLPISRGMISTMYFPLVGSVSVDTIRSAYTDFYKSDPFVRILPAGAFPDTALVRGSNQCHISVELDDRTDLLIVMVAIDNLTKGASGTAVQNMNIMLGLDETAGLDGLSLFP